MIGALSIIPLDFYFNQILSPQKKEQVLKLLLRLVLLGAVLATFSGLVGYFTGFNPLRMVHVQTERNGGLFGMLMTYGHSIAWLSLILVAMCSHFKSIQKLISFGPLLFCIFVSLLGLFTSHVRGAWLAFLAGCLLINKKLTMVLVVLMVLGALGGQLHNPDFFKTQIVRKTSNEERVGSWLAAIKAFQEKPLLGYGYLNFEPHSKEIKERYGLPVADFGGHAHNDFLEF